MKFKFLTSLFVIFIFGCFGGRQEVSPDEEVETPEIPENLFLENAQPFYPVEETIGDIQDQINELRSRVIEYETRITAPGFNTEILKMIKQPKLKHEILMNNGTIIRGSIIHESMDIISIQTHIGQLKIDKADIDNIREIAPNEADLIFDGDANEKIMVNSRIFSGRVQNVGLQRADFVRVIYQLWGTGTDLLATDSVFVEGHQIIYQSGIIADTSVRPGDFAEFSVNVSVPDQSKVQYITRDISWETYD